MKRIIVPSDFSKLSEHALEFAARLAKPIDAEVSVIHLEDLPLGDTSLHLTGEAKGSKISEEDLYNVQLFRSNRNKLQELTDTYSKGGVMVSGQQLGGGFLKGLEHYIENNGADLIILGTSGEESIQELFSGNHTEQLIEHFDTPVLSVQGEVSDEIKDIVVGLDLPNEVYTEQSFKIIKDIAEGLNARIHIVNVLKNDIPEGLNDELNKLANKFGLKNYKVDVLMANDENQGLMRFAQQLHAGLIVTLSEARSGLYRFFQHSFATRMTKDSAIPVLTVNKRLAADK